MTLRRDEGGGGERVGGSKRWCCPHSHSGTTNRVSLLLLNDAAVGDVPVSH